MDMIIKTAYGEYPRCQIDFDKSKSMAKQSFKDECDVNQIMAKYEKTGLLNHVNKYNGEYGIAVGVQDYHTSLNQVIEAKNAFGSLPSKIRLRFGNNPGEFLAFMDNPDNLDEAKKLGLIKTEDGAGGPSSESGADNPDETSKANLEDTTGSQEPKKADQ